MLSEVYGSHMRPIVSGQLAGIANSVHRVLITRSGWRTRSSYAARIHLREHTAPTMRHRSLIQLGLAPSFEGVPGGMLSLRRESERQDKVDSFWSTATISRFTNISL
eukprot:900360-Pyramimonas_sp.AAC.2